MMKTCAAVRYCRVLLVLFAMSLLGLSAPGAAPGNDGKVISERAKAIIEGKGPDVLVFSVHGFKTLMTNRLMVPYNPMLYDENGRAITLEDLKIPCEAYVEYRRAPGKEPQLFRLEVKAYTNGATSQFTESKKPKEPPQ